jgi:Holliday junction resolvase RusA-like endonuclease
MAEIKYIIKGDPRTKKNHQMIAGAGKRCPECKKHEKQWIRQSDYHDEFAEAAKWQLRPIPPRPIECMVNVKCLFYMKTRRRVDQLNLLATIDDLLVEMKILADDNSRIVVGHDGSRVFYDKDNPRTEITITRIIDPVQDAQMRMEDSG